MNDTLIHPLKSEKGFSLTELLIAAGVAIFVSIGVGMIIVQQQDVENTALFQTNLDVSHSLLIQKVRNIKELKHAFGLDPDLSYACFGKSGTACTALINPATGVLPNMGSDSFNDVCLDPPKCFVRATVRYDVLCSPNRCESVKLSVRTGPSTAANAAGRYAQTRETVLTLPGFLFANKTAIDVGCGSNTAILPQTIDYKALIMNCAASTIATPVPCTNNMPLLEFTNSARTCVIAPVASPCAAGNGRGVQRAGLFPGQSVCTT